MSRLAGYTEKIVTSGIPPLAAFTALGLEHLPTAVLVHVLTLLTAWTCISLPVAVLFGHCALEDR